MSLPFTWTLRGHNLISTLYLRIRRPWEKGEREGNDWLVEWSKHTHLPINFTVLCGHSSCYNKNIIDHWSQITITNIAMEEFEILEELPKCDTETQSEQILLEKCTDRFACHRLFLRGCEIEKNSFIALPGKGVHSRVLPWKLCVLLVENLMSSFIATVQGWGCW